MLNARTLFLVALMGLSASAFSAVPDPSATREDRMASAVKDYEGGKKASVVASPTKEMKAHRHAVEQRRMRPTRGHKA